MSVDTATVRRIAHLARIAVADDEVEHLKGELNAILAFVEQLAEVDVEGVEPMTSVTPMDMKKRADEVTDGGIPDDIVRNAPATEGHFFLVPNGSRVSRPFAPPARGAFAAFSRAIAASRRASSAASIENHDSPARSSSRCPAPAECQMLLPTWW